MALKKRILPVPKIHVPCYSALDAYEWLDEYVEITEIKAKIKELKEKKIEILGLSPTKKSFLQQMKKEFEELQNRRINWLSAQIQHKLDRGKHFRIGRIEHDHVAAGRLGPVLTFEDVKKAADLVTWPDDDKSISETERRKEVEAILDEIADLENQLLEKTASYYIVNGAVVTMDARERFVASWQKTQANFSGQVNPQGLRLRESSSAEQAAYDALGIYDFINHDAPATCATYD